MTTVQRILLAAFVLSSSALLTSCGSDDAGALVDLGVTNNGLILRTDAQSCTDKDTVASGVITRSLTAPTLSFSGLSVKWHSTNLKLYVGVIEVTVTSPEITSGKVVVDLDSTEVEALLGATNATLSVAVDSNTPHIYSSTASPKEPSSVAGTTLLPCGLGIGGITLVNGTNSPNFTAQVKIELIGTATSADGLTQQTVIKSIMTTAQYIGGN